MNLDPPLVPTFDTNRARRRRRARRRARRMAVLGVMGLVLCFSVYRLGPWGA